MQKTKLFLDQPKYIIYVFAYFMSPLWMRRLAIAALALTMIALAVIFSTMSSAVSKHAFHYAIFLIPASWFTTYVFIPIWIGTGVRGGILINELILLTLFRLDLERFWEKIYKYFAIVFEGFAYIALFVNIILAPLIALGWVDI